MEPLERLQRRADNVPGRVTHVAIMMNETRVIEMCDERTAEREAIARDCEGGSRRPINGGLRWDASRDCAVHLGGETNAALGRYGYNFRLFRS